MQLLDLIPARTPQLLGPGFDVVVHRQDPGRVSRRQLVVAVWFAHDHTLVNHGLAHAAVSLDVKAATIDQVRDYVDRWVKLDERVHFFAVGPVAPEDVAKTLSAELAAHPAPQPEPTSTEKAGRRVAVPREHTATWDLPIRQYIEYYEVPDESALDRATVLVLANSLFQKLAQRQDLTGRQVRTQASADLVGFGRRYLALSASLPEGVAVEGVSEVFAEVIERALRPQWGNVPPERMAHQIAVKL